MTTRIVINLCKAERDALGRFAAREYREIRAQAALFIRQGLEREGYLELRNEPVEEQIDPADLADADQASDSADDE